MLGRMGPKGRLVPSVHLFSVKLLIESNLASSPTHYTGSLEKKPDNTKNRFPFVPQCPIFGKKRPQQPKSGGFAPILKNRPSDENFVKNRQKMAKNRQKMAKKPDFSGFPENAENRRFSENRKQ